MSADLDSTLSRTLVMLSLVLVPVASGCGSVYEEGTPTKECVTGKRWIAGDMGHPEMHPGRNCVGCHIDNDGPPLALGGTVYAVSTQEVDCYGVEGVTVIITAADNTKFELQTNAAGNFYLEGDPSTFAKPFSAELLGWNADGAPASFKMLGNPETGDCGQCHGAQQGDGIDPERLFPFVNITLQHPLSAYDF